MDAIQEITHSQTPTEGNSPPQDVVDGQAENGSTINMNLADNNAEIQVPAEEHAEISGVSEASHTSTENMELNQTELNVVTPIEVHFTMTALQALAGAVDPYAQSTIMPQLLAHINASSSPELQSLLAEVIAARARRAPVTPHSSAAVRRFIGSLPEVLDLEEGDDCRICWGAYGEHTSFDGGKAEKPVRLPCGHVFGNGCLRVHMSPKLEGGWEKRICPLCRRVIEGVVEVNGGDDNGDDVAVHSEEGS